VIEGQTEETRPKGEFFLNVEALLAKIPNLRRVKKEGHGGGTSGGV